MPLGVGLFNRNRRLVTRFQDRRIRSTILFLDLPAELRNIIYDLCLSFDGVETFFNNYFTKIKDARHPCKIYPPRAPRHTPSILLLCRQITSEAIALLQKKSVVFNHGLLDIKGVTQIISAHSLRNIGTISITAKGHRILKKNIMRESWIGYMDLLSELALVLSNGHRLKNLVIDLTNDDLFLHTSECWYSTNHCDFRDQLKEALNKLRKIRNVGHVKIEGIDAVFAHELKLHMESKPISFVDLPGEIRNRIYKYAADYSDISIQLRKMMSAWADRSKPPPYPTRSTPTVLLLNKQITKEVFSILKNTSLNLVLPAGYNMEKQRDVPNLRRLISAKSLQKIRHLTLDLQSWEWMFGLECFLATLAAKHSLKSFHLTFKDNLKTVFLTTGNKPYPDKMLHESLSPLTKIRGIERVTIDGDLPEGYALPLEHRMQTPAGAVNFPPLLATKGDGTLVEINENDE